ncbi:MAG: protoporphyrinogen oxidase [Acidobacteria bacterium]|nr:protoporphyrinogen oxidase [Acidobacteriota bacterium]MCA1609838.1 protoporphyrinogen oxidase [Acidobacteriota bacterium]
MTTIVVGAGLAGLVCARSLAASGEDVRVLERSERPGGVIRTERRGGFLLEMGPNTVRATPELLGLVRDLGLESDVIVSDPRLPRYIDWNGRLHPLPSSALSLARTPLLSPRGKLRLAAEPFIRRAPLSAPPETVRAFFSRRLGGEVADRVIAPFVSGIFAGDPGRLSAADAFPALARGERLRGSLFATAIGAFRRRDRSAPRILGLLSFRNGLETLPRAIAAALGPRLETGTSVESVSPGRGGWVVRTSRGAIDAERVVIASAAGEAARFVRDFDAEAFVALSSIPSPPVAVLHFSWPAVALPGGLRGFGHLVVPAPGRRVLGAVWSSSLFSGRAPEGELLVTAFAGGARDPGAADLPDEELARIAGLELGQSLGAAADPRLVALTRWPRAIPQYEIGHGHRMAVLARAESRWPGLAFLGSYRGGISVGDVVKSALTIGPADLAHRPAHELMAPLH